MKKITTEIPTKIPRDKALEMLDIYLRKKDYTRTNRKKTSTFCWRKGFLVAYYFIQVEMIEGVVYLEASANSTGAGGILAITILSITSKKEIVKTVEEIKHLLTQSSNVK